MNKKLKMFTIVYNGEEVDVLFITYKSEGHLYTDVYYQNDGDFEYVYGMSHYQPFAKDGHHRHTYDEMYDMGLNYVVNNYLS